MQFRVTYFVRNHPHPVYKVIEAVSEANAKNMIKFLVPDALIIKAENLSNIIK